MCRNEEKEKNSAETVRTGKLLLMRPANQPRAFGPAFDRLLTMFTAKYGPADDAERSLVRQIAEKQWEIERNTQMELAIRDREDARLRASQLELSSFEIAIAARESLAGNKTIAAARKEIIACYRAIAQLERRLAKLQKVWRTPRPVPPTPGPNRGLHLVKPTRGPKAA